MLIDEKKVHAKFANVCPNGAPADLIALMRNRLDVDRGNNFRKTVQHWKDQSYDRLSKLGDQIRALKTAQTENEARAAELQRRLDSVDLASGDTAETGKLLSDLAGCKHHIERLPDALAQAQAEDKKANLQHSELSELARIVDELTRRWSVMTPETKAELLADFLTDEEYKKIFTPEYLEQRRIAQEKAELLADFLTDAEYKKIFTPEYIAQKQAKKEQAEADAKRAKEYDEERRRRQAEEQAAKRAPYDRIDAMTVPEILADLFHPLPPPETLLWHVRTRQGIHEGCSPHLWNWRDDALKVYALNQVIHRVSQNLPID